MNAKKTHVILIDNYDSFTWNVYQYLCKSADIVEVYRNDEITIGTIETKKPTHIVISPGPGHPRDAGISCDVIRFFAGKVPIMGVCLGEQSIFEVFGGTVKHANEIVHGKTSSIVHDGKGLFHGIPSPIHVTRYHSLAADLSTLPSVLECSSRTQSGIAMGVRHKELVIEGVQFHPESILSEHGQQMFQNFMSLRGGKWTDNPGFLQPSTTENGVPVTPSKKETILEQIYARRQQDIQTVASIPGKRFSDLEQYLTMNFAPEPIDFYARLSQSYPQTAVMAEIKRASPSKGPIDMTANAAQQALRYAMGGASVISVLTEPHWFHGNLDDLMYVRKALDTQPNRPALLRKDFIFSKYQILEARLAGADTLLLIVAMLPSESLIRELLEYSRSWGMEPLVEVNNESEMEVALRLGARVIGVNNRNLHDFTVDMGTTSRLSTLIPPANQGEVLMAALSGIMSREDVVQYENAGVRAVLVGEALMRSADPRQFIQTLVGESPKRPRLETKKQG